MATRIETSIDGAIATLRFVGDATVNILSRQTCTDLDGCMKDLVGRPEVRAWVVTGAGKTFLAGADIKELARLGPAEALAFSRFGHEVLARLADAPAVTIAAVNGVALGGGCEIALACDFRVIAADARIGLPETHLGVIPGWGGTQRMARLLGTARAKELVFSGRAVGAEEACKIGLAARLAPAGGVEQAAAELAGSFLAAGPRAVLLAKRAINRGIDLSLAEGLEAEAECFARCFEHDEAKEGLTAFLEKRKPAWR